MDSSYYFSYLNCFLLALASVAQWTECRTVNQRVATWILSQDTCWGCGPGPQQGALERQPHIDVSFPLFLSPFPSQIFKKEQLSFCCHLIQCRFPCETLHAVCNTSAQSLVFKIDLHEREASHLREPLSPHLVQENPGLP